MFGRRAVAMAPVLGADTVTVLRNFSGNPACIRESGNHVADQLRLADAPRVPADDDQAPACGGLFSNWLICFQLWPQDLRCARPIPAGGRKTRIAL